MASNNAELKVRLADVNRTLRYIDNVQKWLIIHGSEKKAVIVKNRAIGTIDALFYLGLVSREERNHLVSKVNIRIEKKA